MHAKQQACKFHFEGNVSVLHELLATQDAITGTWTAAPDTIRACHEFLAGGEDEAEYDLACAVGLSSAAILILGMSMSMLCRLARLKEKKAADISEVSALSILTRQLARQRLQSETGTHAAATAACTPHSSNVNFLSVCIFTFCNFRRTYWIQRQPAA